MDSFLGSGDGVGSSLREETACTEDAFRGDVTMIDR